MRDQRTRDLRDTLYWSDISPSPSSFQPLAFFSPLWLMSLVRYRPLPLTPIKTLGFSAWLPALKQTAGSRRAPSPSPNRRFATPAGAAVVLVAEDRERERKRQSRTGPVSLPRWNPARKNGAIKAECQTIPTWQTGLCRDLVLPSVCLSAGRRGRRTFSLNQSLNWIDH